MPLRHVENDKAGIAINDRKDRPKMILERSRNDLRIVGI